MNRISASGGVSVADLLLTVPFMNLDGAGFWALSSITCDGELLIWVLLKVATSLSVGLQGLCASLFWRRETLQRHATLAFLVPVGVYD